MVLNKKKSLLMGVEVPIQPVFYSYIYNNGIAMVDLPSGIYDIELVYSGSANSGRQELVNANKFTTAFTEKTLFVWNKLTSSDVLNYYPYPLNTATTVKYTTTGTSCLVQFYWGGVLKKSGTKTCASDSLWFGFSNSNNTWKIYSLKVRDINTKNLLYDFRPCLYGDKYGFWDDVSQSFFGKTSGGGRFIGGN